MDLLPVELVTYIFSYITVVDLLNFQVNIYYKNLIRKFRWDHELLISNSNIIKFYTENFNFTNYNTKYSRIRNYKNYNNFTQVIPSIYIKNDNLIYLINYDKIILNNAKISDEGLKIFKNKNYDTISLNKCRYINDKGLKDLKCKKLYLDHVCTKGKFLKKNTSEVIDISYCHDIDNKRIKYLPNSCKELKINECINITDFSYFSNLNKIELNDTEVKDSDLVYFDKCTYISLKSCNKLTYKCTEFLSHCIKLNLSYTNITDESLKFISKCQILDISKCEISGKGLSYLNCIKLSVNFCPISNIYYDHFKKFKKLELIGIYISDLSFLDNCINLKINLEYVESLIPMKLSNIKKLYIKDSDVNNLLYHLHKCNDLKLYNCKIKDQNNLLYLKECNKLSLIRCTMIQKDIINKLKINTIKITNSRNIKKYIRYQGIKSIISY